MIEVFQCQMRLSQNEVQAQERKSGIRTVHLLARDWVYYSKQNMIIKYYYSGCHIYYIQKHNIVYDRELTQFMNEFGEYQQCLFLENHIVIHRNNVFTKINIDYPHQCSRLVGPLTQDIIKSAQISGQSLMTITNEDKHRLAICSLKNFKKSYTLLSKLRITSTQYYKYIVQAFTDRHLYYYDTKMTKQIRKYCNYDQDEPIFNSTYVFVPTFNQREELILIKYDIQSMKRKGTIVTTDRNKLEYDSCIYIKEFNVVGVLYRTRLDLYDFTTLKFIDSQKIHNKYKRKQYMKYDECNGLTIFIN